MAPDHRFSAEGWRCVFKHDATGKTHWPGPQCYPRRGGREQPLSVPSQPEPALHAGKDGLGMAAGGKICYDAGSSWADKQVSFLFSQANRRTCISHPQLFCHAAVSLSARRQTLCGQSCFNSTPWTSPVFGDSCCSLGKCTEKGKDGHLFSLQPFHPSPTFFHCCAQFITEKIQK